MPQPPTPEAIFLHGIKQLLAKISEIWVRNGNLDTLSIELKAIQLKLENGGKIQEGTIVRNDGVVSTPVTEVENCAILLGKIGDLFDAVYVVTEVLKLHAGLVDLGEGVDGDWLDGLWI